MERDLFSREIIRDERSVKAEVREEEIWLRGRAGKVLENIQGKGMELFEKFKSENLAWIEEKKKSFGDYLEGIEWEDIEAQYKEGLLRFIKAHYRIFKKYGSSTDEVEKDVFTESGFEEIIGSYTFDFIRSLRISKRLDIFPNTALEIAKLSYKYNPDILLTLSEKFPELEPWIISRAAVGCSDDPKGFLQNVQNKIPELQQKFPDFEQGLISYAAANNPSDPEGFLQNVQNKIPELQQKFPDFEQGIISIVVVYHPFDPEGFLRDARKRIISLTEQFPNFSKTKIQRAAVCYPQSAEDYLKKLEKLKSDVV